MWLCFFELQQIIEQREFEQQFSKKSSDFLNIKKFWKFKFYMEAIFLASQD